jgi:hypothetical protein
VAPAAPAAATEPAPRPEAAPSVAATGGWQRPAAWTAGAIGLLAIGSGVAAAILAGDANDASRAHCGAAILAPPGQCDAEGVHDHDEAVTRATIADVLLATGGLAVAGSVVLFLVAPREPARVSLLLGPTGGAVRASF